MWAAAAAAIASVSLLGAVLLVPARPGADAEAGGGGGVGGWAAWAAQLGCYAGGAACIWGLGIRWLRGVQSGVAASLDPRVRAWQGGPRLHGWEEVLAVGCPEADCGAAPRQRRPAAGRPRLRLLREAGAVPRLRRVAFVDGVLPEWACERLLAEAASMRWRTKRHKQYPTTDVPVWDIPWLDLLLAEQLRAVLLPALAELAGVDERHLWLRDAFFVRYAAEGQASLGVHHDDTLLSWVVQVSPPRAAVGGGTRFQPLAVDGAGGQGLGPLDAPVGSALLFCGQRRHEGCAVTHGERYILTGFVDLHPSPAGARVVLAHAVRSGLSLPQLLCRLGRPYLLPNLWLMCADCRVDPRSPEAGVQLKTHVDQGYHPAHTNWEECRNAFAYAEDARDIPSLARAMRERMDW
eukprot:TRINITY_DN35159_c0_g1_i1.p1 TRINITY_DN35159_c0_g1~~TRINITY_DN35159_c0_g1_i1.p1  ORF type:complete len:407 (+),score=79.28 TRINITY_DN35159_c0_g1_i1:108-1328(+)